MYWLIHLQERFIVVKTRRAAGRFRYDKTRVRVYYTYMTSNMSHYNANLDAPRM